MTDVFGSSLVKQPFAFVRVAALDRASVCTHPSDHSRQFSFRGSSTALHFVSPLLIWSRSFGLREHSATRPASQQSLGQRLRYAFAQRIHCSAPDLDLKQRFTPTTAYTKPRFTPAPAQFTPTIVDAKSRSTRTAVDNKPRLTPTTVYIKPQLTPTTAYTKPWLTPTTVYSSPRFAPAAAHTEQRLLTTKTLYTNHRLHRSTVYTNHRLHQAAWI